MDPQSAVSANGDYMFRSFCFALLSLLAACSTSSAKSDFDPAEYGYGTSDTTSIIVEDTSVTVTVQQGNCAVYEWTVDGDVLTRMTETAPSSPLSFTGQPGSMMEVDCSNSYVSHLIEPIASWSEDSCVINMTCDGYTEDDVCDYDDVWFYVVPDDRADEECYEGASTGEG